MKEASSHKLQAQCSCSEKEVTYAIYSSEALVVKCEKCYSSFIVYSPTEVYCEKCFARLEEGMIPAAYYYYFYLYCPSHGWVAKGEGMENKKAKGFVKRYMKNS